MMNEKWKEKFDAEILRAESARKDGNEGMARVCARRAAGAMVREYFQRNRIAQTKSQIAALRNLRDLSQSPHIPEEIRVVAEHFTWQITTDHTLPENADLIADAYWLREKLMGE